MKLVLPLFEALVSEAIDAFTPLPLDPFSFLLASNNLKYLLLSHNITVGYCCFQKNYY